MGAETRLIRFMVSLLRGVNKISQYLSVIFRIWIGGLEIKQIMVTFR